MRDVAGAGVDFHFDAPAGLIASHDMPSVVVKLDLADGVDLPQRDRQVLEAGDDEASLPSSASRHDGDVAVGDGTGGRRAELRPQGWPKLALFRNCHNYQKEPGIENAGRAQRFSLGVYWQSIPCCSDSIVLIILTFRQFKLNCDGVSRVAQERFAKKVKKHIFFLAGRENRLFDFTLRTFSPWTINFIESSFVPRVSVEVISVVVA